MLGSSNLLLILPEMSHMTLYMSLDLSDIQLPLVEKWRAVLPWCLSNSQQHAPSVMCGGDCEGDKSSGEEYPRRTAWGFGEKEELQFLPEEWVALGWGEERTLQETAGYKNEHYLLASCWGANWGHSWERKNGAKLPKIAFKFEVSRLEVTSH